MDHADGLLAKYRVFPVGKTRFEPRIDVYNVFNNSAVLNLNSTYGSTRLQPSDILTAQFVKFGA